MWGLVFGVVSGLVLFLYGIEHFSKEIQSVAGERMRSWLGRFTKNPIRGALLGGVLTTVVQSSSATTIIAVGLVNAGAISFSGSLGIIIGANVGSTFTAQLVALKLTSFAPFFIVLGFAISLVGRRYRFLGRPIFYFGLVFLALSLVSDAIAPIAKDPRVPELLARYGNLWIALLAGFLFTVIVQSSSVTTGVVVLLAGSGIIELDQAIPLLLGANLGTTSTSILAASQMSLHARRAAIAHLLFNVGGVVLFLPFVTPFASLVRGWGGDAARQVANAHLAFNCVTALIFLVLVRPFGRLVERLVRGHEEEILFVTEHLTPRLPESSEEAFLQVEAELAHLLQVTRRLFRTAFELIATPTAAATRTVDKLESLNDFLDQQIEQALLTLSKRDLDASANERMMLLIRTSNQLEQLGDTTSAIQRASDNLGEESLPMELRADLAELGARLDHSFEILERDFPQVTPDSIEELKQNQRELRDLINEKYRDHIQHAASDPQYVGAPVVDLLSLCESASNQLREIRKHLESPTALSD
ncbi:MAG: Na/Pi cotransporter family protein [Polyangiaceae bacterium]